MYDTLNLSYTLEISVYQLVTYKKCKMAVKVHILIFRWAIGGMGKYFLTPSMCHPGQKYELIVFRLGDALTRAAGISYGL